MSRKNRGNWKVTVREYASSWGEGTHMEVVAVDRAGREVQLLTFQGAEPVTPEEWVIIDRMSSRITEGGVAPAIASEDARDELDSLPCPDCGRAHGLEHREEHRQQDARDRLQGLFGG